MMKSSIETATTLKDKIETDCFWCGTFNIVWNELKNYVGGNVELLNSASKEVTNLVNNLNKSDFNKDMVSKDSIVIKVGDPNNPKDIEDIKKQVKEKFNEVSEILHHFDKNKKLTKKEQANIRKKFFAYCMLCKKLEFVKKFKELDYFKFKNNRYFDNIAFGIESKKDAGELASQVEVLFYNSDNSFANLLHTKTNDEIILYKNPKGTNFDEMYKNLTKETDKYKDVKYAVNNEEYGFFGERSAEKAEPQYIKGSVFTTEDTLAVPKLELDIEKEFSELYGNLIKVKNDAGEITKAVQKTKFELNETGAKLKSEAAIVFSLCACAEPEPQFTPRHFNYDDNFVIFMREKGESLPYFAGYVSDIKKWQTKLTDEKTKRAAQKNIQR